MLCYNLQWMKSVSQVSCFKEFINMCLILSNVKLQDQFAPTANKEFDPLGPLPHGWGKYHLKLHSLSSILFFSFSFWGMCVCVCICICTLFFLFSREKNRHQWQSIFRSSYNSDNTVGGPKDTRVGNTVCLPKYSLFSPIIDWQGVWKSSRFVFTEHSSDVVVICLHMFLGHKFSVFLSISFKNGFWFSHV